MGKQVKNNEKNMDFTELDESSEYAAGGLYMLYEVFCMGQVRPDGDNCAICGDIDHQAFECRFNPFVRLHKLIKDKR